MRAELSRTEHIMTSDSYVVRHGSPVQRVATDGVGDCVVLAVQGEDKTTHEVDTIVSHLDSQQYLSPANKGTPDNELATMEQRAGMIRWRKFMRSHAYVRSLAATNHVGPTKVPGSMALRLGIVPPTLKVLGEQGSYGASVVVDVAEFKMYRVDPKTGGNPVDIDTLPTYSSVQRKSLPPKREKSQRGFLRTLSEIFLPGYRSRQNAW